MAGGSIRGSDSGVTWRSLLIAFIAIALLAPAGFYIELIVGLSTQVPRVTGLAATTIQWTCSGRLTRNV